MSTVHVVKFNCNISCTFGRTQMQHYIYRDQLVFSTSCTGGICYALFSWPMLFLLFCPSSECHSLNTGPLRKKRNKGNLLSEPPAWFWNVTLCRKGTIIDGEWLSVLAVYLFLSCCFSKPFGSLLWKCKLRAAGCIWAQARISWESWLADNISTKTCLQASDT